VVVHSYVDGETLGTILLMVVGHDVGTYFGLG
jgi:predicted Zn-dependent protease with MMP-like domain